MIYGREDPVSQPTGKYIKSMQKSARLLILVPEPDFDAFGAEFSQYFTGVCVTFRIRRDYGFVMRA
jgi:hypothetical protein